MAARIYAQYTKALRNMKNKIKRLTAKFIALLLSIIELGHRHRKIVLPITIVICILLAWIFISMTSKMIKDNTFSIVFSGLTCRECKSCKLDPETLKKIAEKHQKQFEHMIRRPAAIPDYFYEEAKKTNSNAAKEKSGQEQAKTQRSEERRVGKEC